MDFEDRLRLDTPEGVQLEITLAGLGSRLVSAVIDGLIQFALLIAAVVVLTMLASGNEVADVLAFALFTIMVFMILFGYHVAFETLASGRTPGKRWTGLRVVRVGGRPVGFLASAIRNLLRFVDDAFLIGVIAVLASPRNQRLGDMAAGTLVVRERRGHRPSFTTPLADTRTDDRSWDVATITPEELTTVRRFLERRPSLVPDARARLAWELAQRLRPKVAGAPDDLHPEEFLETLAAIKASRR